MCTVNTLNSWFLGPGNFLELGICKLWVCISISQLLIREFIKYSSQFTATLLAEILRIERDLKFFYRKLGIFKKWIRNRELVRIVYRKVWENGVISTDLPVVSIACLYWLMPQSQCKAGLKMLKIITSIESAIQHSPVTKLNWTEKIFSKFPNWTTV